MNQHEKNEKNSNQKFSDDVLKKVSELMKNNLKLKKRESENNSVTINKQELFKLYMDWVNQVSEECDWKTSFGPEEIVNSIANIIETTPSLLTFSK